MIITYEEVKSFLLWIASGVGAAIGVLVLWIIRTSYTEWKEVSTWYALHKGTNISHIINDITLIKLEQLNMKNDINKGWQDQREIMQRNQEILLERIDHSNENGKHAKELILHLVDKMEDRIDKLEDKI